MKTTKKWFSFIEIIITIWIILIIWVIATTSYSHMLEKTYDWKVTSDLINIKNSIETYYKEYQELPLPNWNQKYYNISWWYEHNYEDEETYWVSWYITENTIEKKYMNYLPLDPRTNQYYWYAKTKKVEWYQISAVVKENQEYKSIVEWKWRWDMWLRNLVKEYNWPNFVSKDSKEHFPYNPAERLLTAKINSYSWSIKINDTILTTPEEIKEYIIKKWDKLEIQQNAKVEIYYSDWTKSILWDKDEKTILTFTDMDYVEENNLYTTIKLTLDMWSIWSKASKLADKSDFEIHTADAVAAVRWTVFWLKKQPSQTNIVLVRWKVEVNKIENWEQKPIISPITLKEDNKTYIEVVKEEQPKWIEIQTPITWANSEPQISTWMLQELNQEEIEELTKSKISEELKKELELVFEQESKKNKLKCNKWYKVVTWKCQEIFDGCKDQTQNSTWAYICDRYNEILKREPSTPEFDKLISQNITREKIEEEISIDGYLWFKNKLEKHFNNNYECKWQKTFRHNYWCVNNNLIDYYDRDWKVVAYAPYNKDLKMWTWESLTGEWETNEFISDYSKWFLEDDWIYQIYDLSTKQFKSWDYNSSTNQRRSTTLNWANLTYENLGFFVKRSEDLAIYDWSENWEKWIFIDNDNYASGEDYIKYNISNLNLGSWSWFAIEMSVRGAALKRNSWQYYLFYNDKISLYKDGNEICIQTNFKNCFNLMSKINVIVWDNINNFYKILVTWNKNNKYDTPNNNTNLNIFINWENISNAENVNQISSLNLYIWSHSDKAYQWNDIIDYVKIYRKN